MATPATTDTTDHQKKIEEKYANELSVGSYVGKNLRGVVITLGAGAAAYFLGKQAAAWRGVSAKEYTFFAPKQANEVFNGIAVRGENLYKWVAGYAGLNLGAMFSTYDIWRKKESAQLAVQELNTDVAQMTAIRAKTDPDLVKEMDSLRGMYDELKTENTTLREKLGLKEGTRGAAKALAQGEQTMLEHATAESTPQETAR